MQPRVFEPASGPSRAGVSEAFRRHYTTQLPVLLRSELLHLRERVIGSAALISYIDLGWTPEDLNEALPGADALHEQLAQCLPYVVSMAAGAAALAVQRGEAAPTQPRAGPSTSPSPQDLPEPSYEALWDHIVAQRKNGRLVDDPAWEDGTKAKHRMTARVQTSLDALEKKFAAAARPLLAPSALRRSIEALADTTHLAPAIQSLEPFPFAARFGPQPPEPEAPSLEHAEALLTHGIRLSRRMQAAASLCAYRLVQEKRWADAAGAWHAAAVAFPGTPTDNRDQVNAHVSAAKAWYRSAEVGLDGAERSHTTDAGSDGHPTRTDTPVAPARVHYADAIASVDRALAALRGLHAAPASLSLPAHRSRVAASISSGPATAVSNQQVAHPASAPEDAWAREIKYRCHRRRADAAHALAVWTRKSLGLSDKTPAAVRSLAADAVQDYETALAHAATTDQQHSTQKNLAVAQEMLGRLDAWASGGPSGTAEPQRQG